MLFASHFASFQGSLSRFCVGGKCSSWQHDVQFRSFVVFPARFLLRTGKNAGISPISRAESVLFQDAVYVRTPRNWGLSKMRQFLKRSLILQIALSSDLSVRCRAPA